jgi:diguanylate cyclase (GGDEF)-like protein
LRWELEQLRVLRRLAHQDVLTGLPNRRLFEQRLMEELSRASRAVTGRGSLVVVDLDDFKHVNDEFGHNVGDVVLREVADVVRTALRAEDLCCRTGGDEFMILLPDTDAGGARMVMARLRAAAIRVGARRNVPISISLGSASWPVDGVRAGILVEKADRAMSLEKRRLRGLARRRPPKGLAGGTKLALVK